MSRDGKLQRKPTVVFILGLGRSGSTVLDLFLGQHPRVQSAGELSNAVNRGWLSGDYCSCGQRVPDCAFWTEVRVRWEQMTQAAPQDYEELRHSVEDCRANLWQMLWIRQPERLRLGGYTAGRFFNYAQWTALLYQAICGVSGRPVVVDSSKNPVRGLALTMMANSLDLIDLRLIHLVRDVRGFAWSARKSFRCDKRSGIPQDIAPRNVAKSAVVWTFINQVADRVRHRHDAGRSMLMRYEDFVQNPAAITLPLATFLDLPPEPWLAIAAGERTIEPGHVVAGNRVRMQHQIKIRPDTEWCSGLTFTEKLVCWLLAGWKARAYGYSARLPVPQHDPAYGADHSLRGPHFLRPEQARGITGERAQVSPH